MCKSQFSSLNFVINSTFRKVFDTRSQDVVDVCLEMFNRVRLPAEQTVAMRKAKFLKRVIVILATCCVRHLLLKPHKLKVDSRRLSGLDLPANPGIEPRFL